MPEENQAINPLHSLENDNNTNQTDLLNDALDEQELFEEVMVRPKMFYLLFLLLSVLLIISGIAGYLIYPLNAKISGTWENSTLGMVLTSEGNSWTAKIENYQGISGYTILYKGQWKATGCNTYDGEKTTLQVLLDKQKIPATEIAEIQKSSPMYKKITDNQKLLQVEYTEAGIKKLFNQKTIDSYFHFSLEPITLQKSKQILYLNHPYFSSERVAFRLNK